MQKTLQIAAIESELRLDSQQPCGRLEWLEDSRRHKERFWRLLKGAADELFPVKLSSVPFTQYNFFYDFITRNHHLPNPALSRHDPASGMKDTSYRELGEAAAARAAGWKAFGAAPGGTVCIIRPMGPDLVTELFAALKIGCRAVIMPLQGTSWIQRRLAVLDPPFIAADRSVLPALKPWRERVLPEGPGGGRAGDGPRDSHVFRTGCPVFAVYDPGRPEDLAPVDVLSDTAWLGALRDGLISLGLGPGQAYCAPGLEFMETFPPLLLAGLLCGATCVHLKPEDIEADPQLAVKNKVKAFGVSKKVRDILTAKPADAAGAWQTWFRNPAESTDMDGWHYFITKMNLQKSYAFNLRWNPAMGGCTLISPRRRGAAHAGVLPAPGSSWQFVDAAGAPSLSDFGMLAVSAPGIPEDEEAKPTRDIIMKHGSELIFGGVDAVHRRGMAYPGNELLEVLKSAYPRLHLSLAAVPRVDPAYPWLIVLLAFHGARTVDRAKTAGEIMSVIRTEMGERHLPDKVEFFPLYPRLLPDMQVDHEWCRSRYLSGWLSLRVEGPAFREITRIRGFLLDGGRAARPERGAP